jgi:hypothetical protein
MPVGVLVGSWHTIEGLVYYVPDAARDEPARSSPLLKLLRQTAVAQLGLSAAQFAADSALPKKDPRRAALKVKLGAMEKALLLREGGLRVVLAARPPPAPASGAILALEGCLRMAPA